MIIIRTIKSTIYTIKGVPMNLPKLVRVNKPACIYTPDPGPLIPRPLEMGRGLGCRPERQAKSLEHSSKTCPHEQGHQTHREDMMQRSGGFKIYIVGSWYQEYIRSIWHMV